jgi:predicted phosphoribosyltransferase
MPARFRDRYEAGQVLAQQLSEYRHRADLLVLGLPRGGVPVAFEVARALDAPFDVFVVRKLGTPGCEELAMGAIASGGVQVINRRLIETLGVSRAMVADVLCREQRELARRDALYREGRPAPILAGRTVVLVDDGLATGATMRAAVAALRQQEPARIVAAVPVGAPGICEELRRQVDDLVCAITPRPFFAVGTGYADFSPTTDEEVRGLLRRGAVRPRIEHRVSVAGH